jgi:hypothetical protein
MYSSFCCNDVTSGKLLYEDYDLNVITAVCSAKYGRLYVLCTVHAGFLVCHHLLTSGADPGFCNGGVDLIQKKLMTFFSSHFTFYF